MRDPLLRVMAALAVGGGCAVSSVPVGPKAWPALVFVRWSPVVAVLLLVGRWRSRTPPGSAGHRPMSEPLGLAGTPPADELPLLPR